MPRKITMKGDDARYTERRNAQLPDDGREILMEGKRAVYEELASESSPHFPLCRSEAEGRQHYEALVRGGFIARSTEMDCWLYAMGYSVNLPASPKPIEWMKNKQLAREMLQQAFGPLIETKELTVAQIEGLAESVFVKQGEPLKLAKPKPEPSFDSDSLKEIFRPKSDYR